MPQRGGNTNLGPLDTSRLSPAERELIERFITAEPTPKKRVPTRVGSKAKRGPSLYCGPAPEHFKPEPTTPPPDVEHVSTRVDRAARRRRR